MNNNSMMRFHNKVMVTRVIGFSIVAVFTLCASVEAQQFKLEGYLKKKDTNNNGRVDPDEMSDNTRGFLKKMGFDPSKPISINKIVAKTNKDRKEATAKASKTSRTRKVPGFGVEGKTESTGVSRFGTSEAAASKSTKSEKFSDSVKKQVKDTLSRYDRNKDGILDKDELRRARWGSPPPEQSDTNKDGRLTKTELANRYAAREKYYRTSNASSSDRSRELAKRKEQEDRERRDKERSRYRSSSSTSSSSSSRTSYRPSSKSSSSKSTSSKSSSSQAKYEKYADSFISQYDTDKDGKLSKKETEKMRRPPAGADTDKDGFITKSELMVSLGGSNKSTPSPPTAKSSDKDKKSARNSRDRESSRVSTRSSSGSSSSFDRLDVNTDRHVHMHEFATKWDDETVEEFYEKDKNGDGVITLREWTGKN